MIIAFNVRANPQARQMARRDSVDIRYYSIIYNVVDDVKAALSGLLAPKQQENFLGYAEIRQVFTNSKVGKVAGCMVRSEEHTSELQSLMRTSYAVFCLKQKTK